MVRLGRIGAGIGLILVGLALLVLPGPGILTIAAGLAVLATEFTWAATTLEWMKRRFRKYFYASQTKPPLSDETDQVSG
jgi:uncharacterized protein (TIGR02611 family)